MAKKSVEIIFSLKDRVSSGLGKIKSGLSRVKSGFGALAKAGAVALGALAAGAVALSGAIKKSFDFETAKVQLKSLLGSVNKASARFEELKKFSASTPFQLPDILKASKLLTVFSEGVLGGAKSLQYIGDAASVAGQNISDVAFWVGRAYSMIQGGKPFGEAAMRLQEMGILTAKGRQEMEDLQKSGASTDAVFGRLTKEMSRFNGGMNDLSKTGNGLISTLKDNWTIAVATFGEAFTDLAKGGLKKAIDTIQELVANGTITKWAESAKEALTTVAKAAEILVKSSEGRSAIFKAIGGVVKAGFIDAANSIIAILLKYAPAVGDAIGAAAKAAFKSIGQDNATAEQRKYAQEQTGGGVGAGGTIGTSKQYNEYLAVIKKFEQINKSKRLEKAGISAAKSVSGATSKTKEALLELGSVIDKYAIDSAEVIDKGAIKSGAAVGHVAEQISMAADEVESVASEPIEVEAPVITVSQPETTTGVGGGDPTGGFAEIAADLISKGLSKKDVSRTMSTVSRYESKGREAGFSGVGSRLAELAGDGMTGLDLSRAGKSMLHAQSKGEEILGSDIDDPMATTNELLQQTNDILKDRLGGVE